MNSKYTFLQCERDHIPDISTLIYQVLGIRTSNDYWEWKYFTNPAGQAISTIILYEGRVIGLQGAVPMRLSIQGSEYLCVQGVDLAILEDFRRFDLCFKMYAVHLESLMKNNIKFEFGFTHISEMNLAKKITSVPRLVKILKTKPFLKQKLFHPFLAETLSPGADFLIRLRFPRKAAIPKGIELKRINSFDERFNFFWKLIKTDYPIMLVLDAAYLNWRYINTDWSNYEIYCLEKKASKEIVGFIVLGEKKSEGFSKGQIYEVITSKNEDLSITRYLIQFAINHFRQKGLDVIDCWMFPNVHIYPQLISMGFISRKKNFDLHFQPIQVEGIPVSASFIENEINWHLSKGYAL